MRTRLRRLLPVVFGVLIPTTAAAQTPRLVPYHMLLDPAGASRAPNLQSANEDTAIRAQTGFVPYFGKNQVRYDRFDWHIYKTDHFEIYFYPALEPHLAEVASYAESAYQHISSTLKHDLAQRVPLIVFSSASEFQENHIAGDDTPEGVLGFSEPEKNRIVIPIDDAPDQVYALITHELTHIFEFDIIPRGIVGTGLPLWVDEGLADYMTGTWNAARPDVRARRGAHRRSAEDEPSRESAARLRADAVQPRPCDVRVHRSQMGHGRTSAVSVLASQERARQQRIGVRRSAEAEAGRFRRTVRPLSQRAVQAVPRQGTAGRLRQEPRARRREDAVCGRDFD